MFSKLKLFARDEDGAVTVDWVVLTASIVALNVFAVVNLLEIGIAENGSYINTKLTEATDPLN